MTDKEFKKLIEGKDLSKQEDLDAMFQAINDSENSLTMRKEESFNKKYNSLDADYKKLKTDMEAAESAAKDSANKYNESEKERINYMNKAFVYKNVDNTLDDAGVNDFITLVNARRSVNDKLSFEDAAKEVKEKYFGKQAEQAPAPQVEPKQPSFGLRAHAGQSNPEDGMADNSIEAQRNRFSALTKSTIKKH